MAELADQVHAELRLLYQNATDNIEFCKKRQWWITNQTLVVYAAIYFASRAGFEEGGLPYLAILAGAMFLVLITVIISSWLILDNHRASGEERNRINHMAYRFSQQFREAREIKKSVKQSTSERKSKQVLGLQFAILFIASGILI